MHVSMTEPVTVVLGAGASRSVSYAHLGDAPSPLDSDFFDLLQRILPNDKDKDAIQDVLRDVRELPAEFRRSLERTFYTLHLRAYLKDLLIPETAGAAKAVISTFARAIEALLRESHGNNWCKHHHALLKGLRQKDAVISFNYDLVVERSIRQEAETRTVGFGAWIYGLEQRPAPYDFPLILKLHGSSNWTLRDVGQSMVPDISQDTWSDFDVASPRLGYVAHSGDQPGILLPFWDKNIEGNPWLYLWKQALEQLNRTKVLLVWGYSLPSTDVKTRELFSLGFSDGGSPLRLCVIDPSGDTRRRWRDLLPNARYWEYDSIQSFFQYPPTWWHS